MVEMVDGVGLVADQVVEAVGRVGVDKAIADPFGGFDPVFLVLVSASYSMSLQIETCRRKKKDSRFANLGDDFKGLLHTFIAN